MKITADTNVLISALGWHGPEARIMEMVIDGVLELCLTVDLLDEFYRVVKYPKFEFTDEEIDGYVGMFMHNAKIVRPSKRINMISEDPDDNIILECAAEGGCKYIISGDKHLLCLKEYEGIIIVKAAEFLNILKPKLSDS